MYIWIWAVLIVQGSLAVLGSLYMSLVKQEEQIVEIPIKPTVPPNEAKSNYIRKKLLF